MAHPVIIMLRANTIRLFAASAFLAVIAAGSTPASGSFPGRNGALAFDAVDRTTQTVQIFRISPTGTGLKRLTTTTSKVWNDDPSFSASGERIYFDSVDGRTTRPNRIYRMNANGTGRQLLDMPSPTTGYWPSVNRSGSSLVMVQFTPLGQGVIVTMNTNGANRRVVAQVTNQQDYLAPEYAPNNGRIAFEGLTHGANGRIQKSDVLVRSVGGRTTNITANKPASFSEPSWAPNGQKLVAIRGQGTLVSMNPNGSDVRVLTTVPPAETSIVGAVYSPDGKKIAYVQCIGGIGDCDDPGFNAKGSIWVMNADGSGNHRVFRGRAVQPGGRLSWQSL